MKKVTPRIIEAFLQKNWFQLSLIALVAIALLQNGRLSNDSANHSQSAQGYAAKMPTTQKMGFSFIPELFSEKPSPTRPAPKNTPIKPSRKIKADSRVEAFIERFAEVALQEESKFDIPASIILANGILLSDLGYNTLAQEAQNYFMVPCTRSWDGDSMEIGDGCYRWYSSPWESFRDHSLFLKAETKNGSLIASTSIVKWARAIENIGWTNMTAKDILRTIVKYDLTKFDTSAE